MEQKIKTFDDYKKRLKEKNRQLGTIIKIRRTERQVTQKQLSDLLGICSQTICQWEAGKKIIPAGIIEDIALLLGYNVDDFFSIPKSNFEEIKFDVESARKDKMEKIIKNILKNTTRCLDVLHEKDYLTMVDI